MRSSPRNRAFVFSRSHGLGCRESQASILYPLLDGFSGTRQPFFRSHNGGPFSHVTFLFRAGQGMNPGINMNMQPNYQNPQFTNPQGQFQNPDFGYAKPNPAY